MSDGSGSHSKTGEQGPELRPGEPDPEPKPREQDPGSKPGEPDLESKPSDPEPGEQDAKPEPSDQATAERVENVVVYSAILVLTGFLGYWLYSEAEASRAAYKAGVDAENPTAAFWLTSAASIVSVRFGSLFLGFVVTVFGCLFVLKGVQTARYQLSLGQPGGTGASLSTSSPGLVTITLGCALVGVSVTSERQLGNPANTLKPSATSENPSDYYEKKEDEYMKVVDEAKKAAKAKAKAAKEAEVAKAAKAKAAKEAEAAKAASPDYSGQEGGR